MTRVALKTLLPAAAAGEPQVEGRLDGTFKGTVTIQPQLPIGQTLSGAGRMTLTDGVSRNLNVTRDVLQRLSVLPGLLQTLEERLPESYHEKLEARDTALEPIDLGMTVQQGVASFADLRVASDTFQLSGTGRVNVDGRLAVQAMLRLDPDLSAAIVRSVKELQYLADADGRLQLPVSVQGVLPRVAVLPDVQYVASRLVATKAQELLGNLLQRVLDKQAGSSQEQPAAPAP